MASNLFIHVTRRHRKNIFLSAIKMQVSSSLIEVWSMLKLAFNHRVIDVG